MLLSRLGGCCLAYPAAAAAVVGVIVAVAVAGNQRISLSPSRSLLLGIPGSVSPTPAAALVIRFSPLLLIPDDDKEGRTSTAAIVAAAAALVFRLPKLEAGLPFSLSREDDDLSFRFAFLAFSLVTPFHLMMMITCAAAEQQQESTVIFLSIFLVHHLSLSVFSVA